MKLAILTTSFPYFPGEQFIEDEIAYWATAPFSEVFMLPGHVQGEPRPVPENIKVDLSLSNLAKLERILFVIQACFSGLLYRELGHLWQAGQVSFYTLLQALKHISITLQLSKKIAAFAKKNGGIDIVYCYWQEVHAYAAILAKHQGVIGKVVCRAHRVDLYEEHRAHAYMPLKRQFINGFDRTFALSAEAKTYLQARYGADPALISISPLGVPVPPGLSAPSPEGRLHIVSVSFCAPVKRIDKLILAIALLADELKTVQVKWVHIGDGPLLDGLQQMADEVFADKQNVQAEFKGNMANVDVKNFYLQESVDIFINTSESEGIPVSIMEAMSAGVPAIAPDVGGISGLVCAADGVLMSANPSVDEIAQSLFKLSATAKQPGLRANVQQFVNEKFNAAINYNGFVKSICSLSEQQ